MRTGQTTDFVLPAALGKAAVMAALPVAVADDSVLCTDGSSLLATAARELDIGHQAGKTVRTRRPWHIQNVNACHSRGKSWVRHCNDISTRHLPNYLGWFRTLDRNARTDGRATRVVAGSGHRPVTLSSANANRA